MGWRRDNTNATFLCARSDTIHALLSCVAMVHDKLIATLGMNVLLAPILYVMESEVESFYCFYALITRGCPRYVSGNLEGVHNACALLTECLGVLDKELSKHIGGLGLDTIMFAFSPLMTLLASLQPLEEVLVAWDFLFLAGPHFAVLLYANHLILMRTTLIQLNSAFK